jgi:plasmid stability protein
MTTLTIRNLDPAVKEKLRVRAAEHGHSMEAEARQILKQALKSDPPRTGREFTSRLRARFEALGGIDLDIPRREPPREPPAFS